jgi:VIT1/CCC1 family predicted Fe2+/Mn2+ transporter
MTVRDNRMTTSTTYSDSTPAQPTNSATRVATASFIGTAIEFYDFYVYATAAALVIGPVFFPQTSGTAQMLSAFLTFGIAFLARPWVRRCSVTSATVSAESPPWWPPCS